MRLVFALVFLLATSVTAFSQMYSKLTGTVYDALGAVIPGAVVIATDSKARVFRTETDSDGVYILSLPVSGSGFQYAQYELSFDREARGFEKFVYKGFRLAPAYGGKMYFDVALTAPDPEPCGYAGDCNFEEIPVSERAISDKIFPRPRSGEKGVRKRKKIHNHIYKK